MKEVKTTVVLDSTLENNLSLQQEMQYQMAQTTVNNLWLGNPAPGKDIEIGNEVLRNVKFLVSIDWAVADKHTTVGYVSYAEA